MSFLVRYFPASVFPLSNVKKREREKRHQLQPVNFNPLPKRMLKIHGYSEQKDSSAKAFTAHQLHKSNIRRNPVFTSKAKSHRSCTYSFGMQHRVHLSFLTVAENVCGSFFCVQRAGVKFPERASESAVPLFSPLRQPQAIVTGYPVGSESAGLTPAVTNNTTVPEGVPDMRYGMKMHLSPSMLYTSSIASMMH